MDISPGKERWPFRVRWFHLEGRGFSEIPMILILSLFLASIAFTFGFRGLNRVDSIEMRQDSIRSFNRLIEVATRLSYGEVGGDRKLELEFQGGEVRVDGRLVQLRGENEIFRSEYLPLPLLGGGDDSYTIRDGSYLIGLAVGSDVTGGGGGNQLVLRLRRVRE